MSWNKLYEQKHWSARHNLAHKIHALVREAIDPNVTPFKEVVDISITAFFRVRPIDSDNIAAKLYIDGLRGWVVDNDNPRHVRSVTTTSLKGMSDYVEIDVTIVKGECYENNGRDCEKDRVAKE